MSRYDPNSADNYEEYEFFRYMQSREESYDLSQKNNRKKGENSLSLGTIIIICLICLIICMLEAQG